MRKLTWLGIITAISLFIYKLFWISVALIGAMLLIRIINKSRHSTPSDSNNILWQKWDR